MEATDSEKVSAAYRWLDIAQEATAREVDRNAPRRNRPDPRDLGDGDI